MSNSFPNPEILTHPNIPKPLHSVNPRSIKGDAWWDMTRREAYAKHDFHCWACGVHKSKAVFHQWLEGHEFYEIDYPAGIVTLKEVTALCHACHNFIHSGRLWVMYKRNQIPLDKIEKILDHGFSILDAAKLKPFFGTAVIFYMVNAGFSVEPAKQMARLRVGDPVITEIAPWEKWHLVLDGKSYFSPFKGIEEWASFYSGGSDA